MDVAFRQGLCLKAQLFQNVAFCVKDLLLSICEVERVQIKNWYWVHSLS